MFQRKKGNAFGLIIIVFLAIVIISLITNNPKNNNNLSKSQLKIPAEVGYVNDFAGVISIENKNNLDSYLKQLDKKTGAEIAVVTLPSLKGNSIEDVALDIGRKWGVGKKGKNISEENAMEYVFGYAAYNDTTARDVQQKRHSGQWFKGKSLDGHGPMGPWVVTAGGVNLDDTRIICRVNGIEKQNASYKQMYFKIPVIISELSRSLTLLPGDIIATGTPSGVGAGRTPQEFMKPGDVMETEITGVGIIRNKIT